TRYLEGVVAKAVRVRVSPSAPEYRISLHPLGTKTHGGETHNGCKADRNPQGITPAGFSFCRPQARWPWSRYDSAREPPRENSEMELRELASITRNEKKKYLMH